MSREIDALTSYTLKHLRDRWWTPAWSAWVNSHLHCEPGDRLAHIGCGNGEVDVALALATPGLHVVSLDAVWRRVRHTRDLGRDVGRELLALTADARALPFGPGSMDAVVCLAVLQHLEDPQAAARALAELVAPGGRILILEPDHESRLWYTEARAGMEAFRIARSLLERRHRERSPGTPPRLGLHVASWLREAGLEPLTVEMLPVSETRLGAPAPGVWDTRERAVGRLVEEESDGMASEAQALAAAVRAYRDEADSQGPAFVEVQHALLVATLAQRPLDVSAFEGAVEAPAS